MGRAVFKADTDRFAELKSVITFIFEHLDKVSLRVNEVDTKMVSKFLQIDNIKKAGETNKEEIDKILAVIKELEQMSTKAEDDLSEIRSDLEACRMNLNLSNRRQKDQKEVQDSLQE